MELDGRCLRSLALIERKTVLHTVIGPACRRLLYVDDVEGRGTELYRLACHNDLEGIVAKWRYGAYFHGDEQPQDRRLVLHAADPVRASRLTWIKVRNPAYSQMAGRNELFTRRASVG